MQSDCGKKLEEKKAEKQTRSGTDSKERR